METITVTVVEVASITRDVVLNVASHTTRRDITQVRVLVLTEKIWVLHVFLACMYVFNLLDSYCTKVQAVFITGVYLTDWIGKMCRSVSLAAELLL